MQNREFPELTFQWRVYITTGQIARVLHVESTKNAFATRINVFTRQKRISREIVRLHIRSILP